MAAMSYSNNTADLISLKHQVKLLESHSYEFRL